MTSTSLLKKSGVYAFASFFVKTINFLLLPIYTVYLTTEDYGIMNVVLSLSTFLSILLLFSLQAAATRFHYDKESLNYREKNIWGTVFILIASFVIATLILFLLFGKYIFTRLIPDVAYNPYIIVGIAYTLFSPIYLLYQFYLQARQEARKYAINMMANFVINVGLILFFVVYLKYRALGVLYAYLITNILFFIYSLIRFLPKISLKYNPVIARKSFKYSLPLVPHSIAGWSMSMLDRLFINDYLGKSETGIYSVGAQMSSVVNTVTSAVYQAYSPWFFKELNDNPNVFHAQNSKITSLIIKVYFLLGIFISFFAEPIVKLITSGSFHGGWVYVPILSWAYIVNGIYYFQVAPLFIKNTRYIPIITLTAAALNIVLFVLLIPRFGGIGASIATFFAFFCSSIMAVVLVRKLEKDFILNIFSIYFLLFISIAISSLAYILNFESETIGIIIKLVIIISAFVAFFYSDRKQIQIIFFSFLNKLKNKNDAK